MNQNRNDSLEESDDSIIVNVPEIHFDCQEGESLQLVRINNGKFELV